MRELTPSKTRSTPLITLKPDWIPPFLALFFLNLRATDLHCFDLPLVSSTLVRKPDLGVLFGSYWWKSNLYLKLYPFETSRYMLMFIISESSPRSLYWECRNQGIVLILTLLYLSWLLFLAGISSILKKCPSFLFPSPIFISMFSLYESWIDR